MNYAVRINNVCDYIQLHLDDGLDLDQLCAISHLSKHHFHRLFTAYTGVSLIKYLYLCRLKRASFQLAFTPEIKIIDIAFNAGFDSHEAFSRAFKKTFKQTPKQFRQQPNWQQWHQPFNYTLPKRNLTMQVDIIYRPCEKIAYIRHQGSPDKVYETAQRFVEWRKSTGLSPICSSNTYGIPYADPTQIDPELFQFDIAGSINQDLTTLNPLIEQGELPAGRYAVIHHQGSHDGLSDAVYYLYREWLSSNSEEAGDFPVYFQYYNFIGQVDEVDLKTDILLLLK